MRVNEFRQLSSYRFTDLRNVLLYTLFQRRPCLFDSSVRIFSAKTFYYRKTFIIRKRLNCRRRAAPVHFGSSVSIYIRTRVALKRNVRNTELIIIHVVIAYVLHARNEKYGTFVNSTLRNASRTILRIVRSFNGVKTHFPSALPKLFRFKATRRYLRRVRTIAINDI